MTAAVQPIPAEWTKGGLPPALVAQHVHKQAAYLHRIGQLPPWRAEYATMVGKVALFPEGLLAHDAKRWTERRIVRREAATGKWVFTIGTPAGRGRFTHMFIELKNPEGDVFNVGFMEPEGHSSRVRSLATDYGTVTSPDPFIYIHPVIERHSCDITAEGADRLFQFIERERDGGRGFYWYQSNCTTFIKEAAAAAGLEDLHAEATPLYLVSSKLDRGWDKLPKIIRTVTEVVTKILLYPFLLGYNVVRCIFGATVGVTVNGRKVAMFTSAREFFWQGVTFHAPHKVLHHARTHGLRLKA